MYGALRSGDGALTLLVINKTGSSIAAPLDLSNASPAGAAQVWRWTGDGISRAADETLADDRLSTTYPAQSLTLLVVPLAGSPPSGGRGDGGGGGGSQAAPAPAPIAAAPPAGAGEPPTGGGSGPAPGTGAMAPTCRAPRVVGLTLRAAKRTISRAHCLPGRPRKVFSSTAKGRVSVQSPRAGRRPARGRTVGLGISRGPRHGR